MKKLVMITLGLLLTACKHDSKTADDTASVSDNLDTIVIAAGDTFGFTLQATDSSGNALFYISDGSVGPGKNPYTQTHPATFDSRTGKFEWTPTSMELGDYSVQFTAGNSDAQALADNNNLLAITIRTGTDYGHAKYAQHCATCHGADGTGDGAPTIRGKTAAEIAGALQSVSVMQPLQETLSARDIEHLAEHLANLPHIQYELPLGCIHCHDGIQVSGKSATHIMTTDLCAACHALGAWLPKMDHVQTVGTCADCHNTTIAHARTTDQCAACHATDTWHVLKMDHTQLIQPISCPDCHSINSDPP